METSTQSYAVSELRLLTRPGVDSSLWLMFRWMMGDGVSKKMQS